MESLGRRQVVAAVVGFIHWGGPPDAKGPHGFTLHFHAQVGGKESENVLDYLQSIKKIELKPNPFLKKPGGTVTKTAK